MGSPRWSRRASAGNRKNAPPPHGVIKKPDCFFSIFKKSVTVVTLFSNTHLVFHSKYAIISRDDHNTPGLFNIAREKRNVNKFIQD